MFLGTLHVAIGKGIPVGYLHDLHSLAYTVEMEFPELFKFAVAVPL